MQAFDLVPPCDPSLTVGLPAVWAIRPAVLMLAAAKSSSSLDSPSRQKDTRPKLRSPV